MIIPLRQLKLRHASRIALWGMALWLGAMQVHAASLLDIYTERAAQRLDPRAQDALDQIPQLDRKLLALRGYLRSGTQFGDRWSWTTAEIARYQDSPERAATLAEIERIRARFAAMNPGYSLRVNADVRSLDVQIARWNANAGVARTAVQLHHDTDRELDVHDYPTQPTTVSTERFATFLQAWVPATPAPLAVPGLSRHGQARAYDFHIMHGEHIVAGTDMGLVRSVWEREGWTQKLKSAVTAGSGRFKGPLAAPYEPWHYEYSNDASLADNERAHLRESGS